MSRRRMPGRHAAATMTAALVAGSAGRVRPGRHLDPCGVGNRTAAASPSPSTTPTWSPAVSAPTVPRSATSGQTPRVAETPSPPVPSVTLANGNLRAPRQRRPPLLHPAPPHRSPPPR